MGRRERARGHLKHRSYCTCGKVVRGNGGIYQHRRMHERKGDGHRYMSYSAWCDRVKTCPHVGVNAGNHCPICGGFVPMTKEPINGG